MTALLLLLSCLSGFGHGAVRGVFEGTATSSNTLFISTTGPYALYLSTRAYGDGVPNVSLYTTSNVVVGDGNACVLYSTGSATCTSFSGSGAGLTGVLSSYSVGYSSAFVDPNTTSSVYVGVGGSTVTMTGTTAGNRVCVSGSFVWYNNTAGAHSTAQVMLDGTVLGAVCYVNEVSGSREKQCSFSSWSAVLGSGGSHTVSLMVKVDAGTLTISTGAESYLIANECRP